VKKGDKIGVMLFAVPKKGLAPLLAVLASLGVEVKGVETTVTAMANFLLFCAGDTMDPVAAVGGHDGDLELVGVQNRERGWRQVPELLYSYWLPESKFAEGARRELLQQCVKSAAKLYSWGAGRYALGSADGEPPSWNDLVIAGNQRKERQKSPTLRCCRGGRGAARVVRLSPATFSERKRRTVSGLDPLLM
jgi:hypothetical protein